MSLRARIRAAGKTVAASLLIAATGCQTSTPLPRDYYFSPVGEDKSGTGSADRPFRSIVKANALRLNPGDRLLFQAGQTFRGNLVLDARDAGTPQQPITVASFGDGRARIEAGADTGIHVQNAGGVRIADLIIVGAGPRANTGNGVEVVNTLSSGRMLQYIRIENVQTSGFGQEGVWVYGSPGVRRPSGFDDVLISDCVARGNARTGFYVSGRWLARWGRQSQAFAHSNVRLVRCLADGNSGDSLTSAENRSGSGILLDSVDGGVIEYCEATGNGANNRSRNGGPVGIWCTMSNRITIQYCKSHRNRTGGRHDGGGFCLDGGVCNSVVQHNLSEENDGAGYGLYQYLGAPPALGNTVRLNTSRNDGRRNGYAGIHVWDDSGTMSDVRIEGNRVEMAAPLPSTVKPPRGLWLQSPVSDVWITDNQFVMTGSGVRLMDVAAGQLRVRLDGNTYHVDSDAIQAEWHGRAFTSLGAWLHATGQTADGQRGSVNDKLGRKAEVHR